MSLFRSRRPRKFDIGNIYVNERKDRLRAIEQKARRELGMTVNSEQTLRRGMFMDNSRHIRRKGTGRNRRSPFFVANIFLLLLILLILFVTCRIFLRL